MSRQLNWGDEDLMDIVDCDVDATKAPLDGNVAALGGDVQVRAASPSDGRPIQTGSWWARLDVM